MKSFCRSGLIAAALVGCTVQVANAQEGANSSLPPWPNSQPPARYASNSYYTPSPSPTPAATSNTASWDPPAEGAQSQLTSDFDPLNASCWSCDCCTARGWFVSVGALAMGRNRAPAFWTTSTEDDDFNLLMNTQSAGANWAPGGQVTIGYAWRGQGGPGIAFTYWGLAPMEAFASVSDTTGNPATALHGRLIDWSGVTINGNPATDYFESAQEQALWRHDVVENFEVNALSGTYTVGWLQVAGLAGFRYFRFSENLTYGSASFGNSFTSNGGADAAYLEFRCRNNLYGGQVGAVLSSVWTHRLTAFVVPKVGIYGNQMNNQTLLYAGNAVNTPDVDVASHKSDASVLSEIDFGMSWAFRPYWQLIYGYRVVSVSNLSLADNQFISISTLDVEQSGSLILHGAFIGVGLTF